ncbi:MAG TPA: nucleotide exchange factor GrpE, partial [Hyalangium sp.]|nr:nucleotide exchange factor GrpE [Hyalangium sp.]
MSGTNEKGNFSANIAQEVIDAALKSVERRNTPSEESVTLEVESAEPPAEEPGVSVEMSEPDTASSAQVEELTAALDA